MGVIILRCPTCLSYSISKECPCGGQRVSPRPAKYSPIDKYGEYRRKAKRGLLHGEIVEH